MIRIGRRLIGPGQRAFIIAEAGVNHNGNVRLAKRLIDAAASTGADAVKFQTYQVEELASRTAPKAAYQRRAVPGQSQFEMLRRLALPDKALAGLKARAKALGIVFLSSPFDAPSAELLSRIGVPAFKVASGEITNLPLLKQIAGYGKPILLSTGMSTLAEVKTAVQAIRASGNKRIVLLQCLSCYPAPFAGVNLRAIKTMENALGVPVGYSDHTLGTEIPIAAVAMGACVIEKHLTLDRNLPGPDHKASAEPDEFRDMVRQIRNVELALGDGDKRPQPSELPTRAVARKSIVARRALSKGAVLTAGLVAIKRPGTGISPALLNKVLGRRLKRNIRADQMLDWGMLK